MINEISPFLTLVNSNIYTYKTTAISAFEFYEVYRKASYLLTEIYSWGYYENEDKSIFLSADKYERRSDLTGVIINGTSLHVRHL